MKRLVLSILLTFTAFSLMAQSWENIPHDLWKYDQISGDKTLESLIGDTIVFDTIFFDYEDNVQTKRFYTLDTTWKKDIKDKSKAKLNKHYTIEPTYFNLSDIQGIPFLVVTVKGRDHDAYHKNYYKDVYLYDITHDRLVTWTYDLVEFTKNPDYKIKVNKVSLLLDSLLSGKEKYYYTGDNQDDSKYWAKEDYRNYIKLKYTNCDFSIEGSRLFSKYDITCTDDKGKNYSFDLYNYYKSTDLISPAKYETLKRNTINRLKTKGRYYYTLSKIEKPTNPTIRYGKFQEIKTEDNLSKYQYEDNVLSILWYGTEEQFIFSLKNKSQNSLKIVWDDAAFVNNKNESSKIIHQGIKYIDANKPQSPTIIPKGAEINDLIAPTDRIAYYDGKYSKSWYSKTMIEGANRYDKDIDGQCVQVLLPIEIRGVLNEYIFTFKLVWIYDYPELQDK